MPSCTTHVPNIIMDHYLKELKLAELKVLLVVIRQTLGWEDKKTKSTRKEIDWISSSQLAFKTGCSKRAINEAIQGLIEKNLINVYSFSGDFLDAPEKRRGQQKLFFCLSSAISAVVENERIPCLQTPLRNPANAFFEGDFRKKVSELTQKLRITKETIQN